MQKLFSYLWTIVFILFIFYIVMMSYIFYNGFQTIEKPKSIYYELFLKISTNKWDDSNESFTKFIIENGERIVSENLNPIILLNNSSDYQNLLAYVKYLEFKERHNEAYRIYIDVFKGFKSFDKSIDNLSKRILIEEVVCKVLNQNLSNNVFSKELKSSLKKELQELLIVDKTFLLKSIEYEFTSASKSHREDILKLLQEKIILTKVKKKMIEIELDYVEEYIHESYLELNELVKKSTLIEFNVYIKKKKEKMYSFLKDKENSKVLKKLKNNFNTSHSRNDYLQLTKFQAKLTAFSISYVLYDYVSSYHQKYLERIEKNKMLLEELRND